MDKTLHEITGVVGSDSIKITNTDNELTSNKYPKALVYPRSDDQISEILKICNKDRITVSPQGGGTKKFIGNSTVNSEIIISTKNINSIIEHFRDDMIVVTQSGIAMKDLQTALRTHNQFLALDPPHIEYGCTIGGIISTNDYGPLRQRYGSIRENLLALKFVRPDGNIVSSGAKVVKNVAGYDIQKFMAGSLGTLGLITEATLRLYPIPENSRTLIVKFGTLDGISKIINSLLNSDFAFNSFELVTGNVTDYNTQYLLALKIQNVAKAVEEQVKQINNFFNIAGFNHQLIIDNETEKDFWHKISNFPYYSDSNNKLTLKIRIPISGVADLFQYFEYISRSTDSMVKLSSSAGIGVINATFENNDDVLTGQFSDIANKVGDLNGYVSVLQAPVSIKSKFDVFGKIDYKLIKIMKDIKSRFDPHNIMNNGIFIDNI